MEQLNKIVLVFLPSLYNHEGISSDIFYLAIFGCWLFIINGSVNLSFFIVSLIYKIKLEILKLKSLAKSA